MSIRQSALRLLGAVLLLGGVMWPPAQAATPVVAGGRLVGFNNVDLGSYGVYNMTFRGGSCAENFAGCDSLGDLPFTDFFSVGAAGGAIYRLLESIEPRFTSFMIGDCVPQAIVRDRCIIGIPYDLYENKVGTYYGNTHIFYVFGDGSLEPRYWDFEDPNIPPDQVDGHFNYAVFRPVPEPSTLALAGLGGFLLAWAGRRRRMQT